MDRNTVTQAPPTSEPMTINRRLTRPADMVCTCMRCETPELWAAWSRRARPVVARLLAHGHRIDTERYIGTLALIRGIDGGHPASFSPGNWHRSHHQRGCQFSGRRTPMAGVDASADAACAWGRQCNP